MSRKSRNRKQKVREMTIPAFPPVVVVEVDETAEVTESAVAEVAEQTAPEEKNFVTELLNAVEKLQDGDFTDSCIALSERAEQVAELFRQTFIGDDEMPDMRKINLFNQQVLDMPTKYGIVSLFVMYDKNDEWKTMDILMIEQELWATANHVSDFHWVIPIANRGETTEELFAETRKNYAEICLA